MDEKDELIAEYDALVNKPSLLRHWPDTSTWNRVVRETMVSQGKYAKELKKKIAKLERELADLERPEMPPEYPRSRPSQPPERPEMPPEYPRS